MPDVPHGLVSGGERWRAPYASDPAASRGRVHPEAEDPLRSPFQRDRDRIIHSNAFRRLKHKTQVFIHHEGDHFRTRLTHSLEVAQIARSIARPLGLDEDLTEALALAHDLGHTPFGHAGERALDRALAPLGGFDHNRQSLRVVTELERRYPRFDGLNLAWETLEGLIKHNGPLRDGSSHPVTASLGSASSYPGTLREELDLNLGLFASLEAQVAAIADDVAYDCHDLEDGLRAGLLGLDALANEPLTGPILRAIRAEYPDLGPSRTVHELIRRVLGGMIADILAQTAEAIRAGRIESDQDARLAGASVVQFSPPFAEAERSLKEFLLGNLYRNDVVMRPVGQAEALVTDLFEAFSADPTLMPDDWGTGLDGEDRSRTARRAADYIAGMTDRYAVAEHRRLFGATPDLG